MLFQHVLGQDLHDLIAPKDSPLAVDDTDAVGVAVEGKANSRTLLLHFGDQLLKVFWYGGIWMVGREGAVDGAVQDGMLAGQPLDEFGHGFCAGAVAWIPDRRDLACAREIRQQPVNIAPECRCA